MRMVVPMDNLDRFLFERIEGVRLHSKNNKKIFALYLILEPFLKFWNRNHEIIPRFHSAQVITN